MFDDIVQQIKKKIYTFEERTKDNKSSYRVQRQGYIPALHLFKTSRLLWKMR